MEIAAPLLAVALFLAVAIERTIENLVAPVVPDEYAVSLRYAALVLGLVAAFGFGVDLITPGLESAGIVPAVPWAGKALTGIALGGGSNLVHDWWPSDGV